MADDVQLPETTRYRVVLGFAIYDSPQVNYNARGEGEVIYVRRFATRSQEVDLIDREADRLVALDAVVPADEERHYDEMSDAELADLTRERGLVVRSSGADPAQPLRADFLAALDTFDRGEVQQGFGAGTVPGGVASGGTRIAEFGEEPLGESQPVADVASIDVASASVEEVAAHIEQQKLTAPETVDLAGDDPVLAEKVLAAENAAHDGDGRKSVVDPLDKIANG